MAQVNNFDGGISTRIDPTLIKLNQAQELVNVDTNAVVLKSLKDTGAADPKIKAGAENRYAFYYKNKLVFFQHSYFVEYVGKLYYKKNDTLKCYDGSNEDNIGLLKPTANLAVDSGNKPVLNDNNEQVKGILITIQKNTSIRSSDIPVVITKDTVGNLARGSHTYLITLVMNDKDISSLNKTVSLSSHNAVKFVFAKNAGLKVRLYRTYSGTPRRISEMVLNKEITVIDKVNDISSKTAYTSLSSISRGKVHYTETFYNKNRGIESAPSEYSEKKTVPADSRVVLSNFATKTDTQITHRRIYRLGGNLTKMTLIAEIPITQVSFTDYVSDVKATRILDTANHYPPDNTMHSLVEAYGIFFGLVGNELRFSEIGEPSVWPPENSLKLNANGTGILPISQGILVFTTYTTYLLYGTNKSKFSLTIISKQQGCVNHSSCRVIKNFPLWISKDGICSINSGYVSVISKPLLGKINISLITTIVYDEQYFILKNDKPFTNSLLVLDMRSGLRFYEIKFKFPSNTPPVGLHIKDKNLYVVDQTGFIRECFQGGRGDLTLTYTSPVFIEGNHSLIKMYNKFYIRANGDFTVKIYIDYNLVLTKRINGNKTFELTPPTDKQRGYSCYFNIVGKGTVYTIDTKPISTR